MIQMIRLNEINELLEEYNLAKNEGESFSEFIKVSGYDGGGFKMFDWDWVSEQGIVTKENFYNTFSKEFVEENFDNLAHDLFKGMEGQIDFGILLDCVKEEWEDKYNKWKVKNKVKMDR